MTSTRAQAEEYLARGWAVVPLSRDDKRPVHEDWPAHAAARAFEPEHFDDANVGVVLGHVSGHLVDVDLDSAAALQLAPYFLPATCTFGRASKPDSHWLYISEGCRSCKLWFAVADGDRELVEIRATNASNDECGHQTAFPGSTHPSGEIVEWSTTPDSDPTPIEAGDLLWAVSRLVVACIIAQDWTEGSSRHEKSLGITGGLLKAGWTADEVRDCLAAVRQVCGDSSSNESDFSHDVEHTIQSFEQGQEVTGFGTLIENGVLTPNTAAELQKHARTPETRAKEAQMATSRALGGKLRSQIIAEARETDGMTSAYALVATRASTARTIVSGRQAAPDAPSSVAASEGALLHPIFSFGDIVDLTKDPEPLAYLWGPFAPGKVSAIGGFANAGKSPFLQSMLMHSAAGKPTFLGKPISKQKCALLDFETGRLAEIRARRLARGMGLAAPPPEFLMLHMKATIDEAMLEALEDWVGKEDIGVVGIDTYGAAAGPLDHNSPEFSHWLKMLGVLSRDANVLVIVLMHEKKTLDGKRKVSGLEMLSGHNSAPGALQGAVSLYHPDDDDPSLISVLCSRAPEESFEPFDVKWTDLVDPSRPVPASGVARAIGSKWGLGIEVVPESEEEKASRKAGKKGKAKAPSSDDIKAQIDAASPKVLELMTVQANDGSKLAYTDVAAAVTGRNEVVRWAIDALVKAGRLCGDYIVGTPPSRTRPRHIWLPRREKSEAGMIQP